MRPILCSWFPGKCSSRVYEAVMGILPRAVENACLYGQGLLPAAALDAQAVEVYNGIIANMTAGAKEAVNQKVAKFQGKLSAMAAMFDYRHRPSIFAVDDAQIKAKYPGTQIEAKWWDRDRPTELLFRGECSIVPVEDLPDCLSALAMRFESQTIR